MFERIVLRQLLAKYSEGLEFGSFFDHSVSFRDSPESASELVMGRSRFRRQISSLHYHCCLAFVTHCTCKHCQELAPVWDQLANKCADSSSGPRIAKVCYPWSLQ